MNLEREVGLADLFWYVVSKWRLLIIALVIGALAGAVYSYVSTGKVRVVELTDEEAEEEAKKGKTEEAVSEENLLTAETVTINDLDSYDIAALNLYFQYMDLIADQTDYVTTAEFMKIDPYTACISSASYYVKCANAATLGGVLEAYMEVCRDMNTEYGELFDYKIDKDSEGYATSSEDTESEEEDYSNSLSGNGIIRITLYAGDTQTADERVLNVENALFSRSQEISKTVGAHVLEKIGSYSSRVRSSYILNKQKSATDTLYSLTNYLNNVKKTFSPNAALYAEKITNDPDITDYSEIVLYASDRTFLSKDEQAAGAGEAVAEGEDSSEPKVKVIYPSKSLKKRISKKLMVLGALVFLVLAALILAIYYLLNKKLRPEDDITRMYGLPGFGLIRDPNRKKRTGLDRYIEKKRLRRVTVLEDGAEEMMAANIELRAKAAGAKSVYATGTLFGEKEKALVEKAAALLEEKGIRLVAGEPVLTNAKALEEMGNADCAVILEQAYGADRIQTAKLIRFCSERSITPIGLAIVE